ncbi:MAG: FliO/MopB family protein [Solirubrobacteraceae bacterium]
MKSIIFTRGSRLTWVFLLLCSASLYLSAPAQAAAGSSPSFGANTALHLSSSRTSAHTSSGSLSATVVRTIVGLLVVIAVIYGIGWLMRQAKSARNPASGDGLVQIATLPLGTNRSVALVRVGAELHLLGLADHGITSIRVFNEEEAYELGLPFEPEETHSTVHATGIAPIQSVINTLRRLTVR